MSVRVKVSKLLGSSIDGARDAEGICSIRRQLETLNIVETRFARAYEVFFPPFHSAPLRHRYDDA
jgi:hypothetical protein